MTVGLTISKTKTLYLIFGVLAALAMTTWASQRDVLSDTANYYSFYRHLLTSGITSIFSCQSFEPLFCGGSYALVSLTGSEAAVHFIWVFLYYAVTLRAFLLLWPLFIPQYTYTVLSLLTFMFVALNYVDAQAVYFLTRQYVAAAFLMLGAVHCARQKNPIIAFACATMIHLGSLPIAALLFVATRPRIDWKFIAVALAGLAIFVFYLANLTIFDFYLDSIQTRVELYANKNDGTVTIMQEIRLLLYWALALIIFRNARSNLFLPYILIYIAYLFTFQNDLYHLRYHKYLEVLAWPSVFILFGIQKEATGYLVASALFYRIYKYVSLLAPESAAPPMARILWLGFMSFVSWLSLS
jgi:hypothetical protein